MTMISVDHSNVSVKEDISELVPALANRLKRFHLEQQPVSMFGGSDMTCLQIEMSGKKLRAFKIMHPGKGSLNLSKIKVFDRAGFLIDLSAASIKISSLYDYTADDSKEFLQRSNEVKNDLFGFSEKSTNFRTAVEDNPWVVVDLGEVTSVERIELSTKRNHLAKRDWMLDIACTEDLIEWNNEHSQSDSLTQRMAAELEYASADMTALEYKIYSQSLKISEIYIRNGRLSMRKITEDLTANELDIDEQAGVKFCVNTILRPFQAEIASHGVTRSYRFWSDKEKQAELEHANKVVALLKDLVGEACLGFGSCLGAVREGDFIPHDDDIDIIVFHKESDEQEFMPATKDMLKILLDNGINAKYTTEFHVKVSLAPGKVVDVFCGLARKGHLDWHPGKKALHTYDDVFPAVSIPFMGIESLIPKNAVLYLERVYGKSWRVPMPFFAHYSKRNSNFSAVEKAA